MFVFHRHTFHIKVNFAKWNFSFCFCFLVRLRNRFSLVDIFLLSFWQWKLLIQFDFKIWIVCGKLTVCIMLGKVSTTASPQLIRESMASNLISLFAGNNTTTMQQQCKQWMHIDTFDVKKNDANLHRYTAHSTCQPLWCILCAFCISYSSSTFCQAKAHTHIYIYIHAHGERAHARAHNRFDLIAFTSTIITIIINIVIITHTVSSVKWPTKLEQNQWHCTCEKHSGEQQKHKWRAYYNSAWYTYVYVCALYYIIFFFWLCKGYFPTPSKNWSQSSPA